MKKKILFLIVGCLRPGFIRHINSWGPIIRSFKNIEILYVLQDQINLIPELISNKKWKDNEFTDEERRHLFNRLFGFISEEIQIIENFCKKSNILPLDVPPLQQYSSPIDYSFLYETLPFLTELKCNILLLDNNIQYGHVGKMYASWQSAREYIISNNINFDYCVKIRPDYSTILTPDKFNDLFGYCVATNNIVLDWVWAPKDSVVRAGDQAAIGSYKNIMIYLNAGTVRDGRIGSFDTHIMLRNYLKDFNITIANGRPFLESNIVSWELQKNRYFKDFLLENINRKNYSEFLALLNQFSTSL
jgi:hypothetical protein